MEDLQERPAVFDADGDAYYELPTTCGLHLCGAAVHPEDEKNFEQAFTAASLIIAEDQARILFAIARKAGHCSKVEQDYVFDLVIDGDVEADFFTNRQLMQPIRAAIAEHIEGKTQ